MSLVVVKNPKGRFNIFSSDIDAFVAKDLTSAQVIDWYQIAAKNMAEEIVEALSKGENPFGDGYLSYEDCMAIIREFNPDEGEDCPIVNPSYAS